MKQLLVSLRMRQWTKNLLVFAGLIFAGRFRVGEDVLTATLTFAAFCMVSSAGYLVNDIVDRESDKIHPEKRRRPIASGDVSPAAALVAAAILLMAGFAVGFIAHINALLALGAYVLNQAVYIFIARKLAILDVFVIAFGFLIRAVAGAAALEVDISSWLLLCTLLLALFLGFSKRKYELDLAAAPRASLAGYSPPLLNQLIGVSAGAALISYSIYAIQSETALAHPMLVLTIPFPIFGIFRYLQITYHYEDGGNPDRALVRDPWLAATVVLWAALSVFAMSRDGWGAL